MGQSQPINRFPVLTAPDLESEPVPAKSAALLARLHAAQVKAFALAGDGVDYSDWLAAWSLEQDPVAYAFDMLGQQDRQKYFDSLSGDEKRRLVASLHTAHKLGVCSPPGWRVSQ
jgi:hypothetical protein